MRRLIHIPVVHAQVDMGSLSDHVRALYIAYKGERAWRESRRAIACFWRELDRKIAALDLACDRLRLYQDGLPVCGREADIVRDLARAGGPNHRILLDLMDRGATVEGTEDPTLLLQEYNLLKAGMAAPPPVAATLLDQRDRFIAGRIDATLRPGETGMLFLGAHHHVVRMLPATIAVRRLDDARIEKRAARDTQQSGG